MILGSAAGWKLHVLASKDPRSPSACGLEPWSGWTFIEEGEGIENLKEEHVCGNCLQASGQEFPEG